MLRCPSERLAQAFLLEIGFFALVTPAYIALSGAGAVESAGMMAAIAAVELVFTPLYCALFDRVELARTGRVASARPAGLRAVHALGHEVMVMAASVPIILVATGHGLGAALAIDLGLTLAALAWVWLFFWGWDRVRPVRRRPVRVPEPPVFRRSRVESPVEVPPCPISRREATSTATK